MASAPQKPSGSGTAQTEEAAERSKMDKLKRMASSVEIGRGVLGGLKFSVSLSPGLEIKAIIHFRHRKKKKSSQIYK